MTVGVRIEHLCVHFFGRQVLQDITVDFPAKSLSVLIGRSGSGKTTLLRSINRLNEEFEGCSTSGQIYLATSQGRYRVYPSGVTPAQKSMVWADKHKTGNRQNPPPAGHLSTKGLSDDQGLCHDRGSIANTGVCQDKEFLGRNGDFLDNKVSLGNQNSLDSQALLDSRVLEDSRVSLGDYVSEKCATCSDMENYQDISLTELRLRVGMLFQTPNVFPVSIFRNVAMPLTLVGGCPKPLVEERVYDSLRLVGLWDEVKDSLNKPADRLSGGQQQRLCLARVLALRPEILLLDEPTASLDVHASRHIEDVLSQLAEKYTIIMVSHGLAQARRLGRMLLICEDGRITHQLQDSKELSESLLETMV